MALHVAPIPVLSDNYCWHLTDTATGTVAVCDPGEAGPVLQALEAAGGRLDLILLTHHHGDHVDGVEALRRRFGARVVGGAYDVHRLPKLDQAVREGDTVAVGGCEAAVLHTPGHTSGHIAFHFAGAHALLCGDTLFALGCGRLLEGTAKEMYGSLRKFAALPENTRAYCGHEYTLSNAKFARHVDPDNAALRAQAEAFAALREADRPTVPTTIAEEKTANPFMRARDVAALATLRTAKDNFR